VLFYESFDEVADATAFYYRSAAMNAITNNGENYIKIKLIGSNHYCLFA